MSVEVGHLSSTGYLSASKRDKNTLILHEDSQWSRNKCPDYSNNLKEDEGYVLVAMISPTSLILIFGCDNNSW